MRDESRWRPSKYRVQQGTLKPSLDRRELAPSSRLFASLIADFYNEAIPDFSFGSLLDLGCGKQPLYGKYRDHATNVIAVDWPNSLHESRHLDAYCDLSRPLPFAGESFDTVLSSDVLEHLPSPELMFCEVARVLRPGGTLLLNTPFLYPVHEAPHDYLRHTRFSLLRLSREAGLEVTGLVPIGGALDVLADMVGKLLGRLPTIGDAAAGALQSVAIRLRRNRLWRRATAMSADYFPLGHGLIARKVTPRDAPPESRGRGRAG